MNKIVIAFIAVCCINSVILAQEAQKLEYFEEDNTFYLDGRRLSNESISRTLSSNPSAREAWMRGNLLKERNKTMKVVTSVLLPVGGVTLLAPIIFWPAFLFDAEGATTCFIVGAVFTSLGIVTAIMIPITKSNYKLHYSGAAYLYNKGLKPNAVSLHIGTTGNGLGFSLKF